MRDLVTLTVALLVAAGGFAVLMRFRYAKLRDVRLRSQQGRRSFELSALPLGSSEVVSRVYEHFENLTPNKLPVLVGDELDEVYGIVGGDVLEEISLVAERCQVPLPSAADVSRVRTVGEVVCLLESLRNREGSPASD